MIYTSYYAKARRLNPNDYIFVKISNSAPMDFNFHYTPLDILVPQWSIVDAYRKGIISEEEYTEKYEAQFTPVKIDIAKKALAVLEKSGKPVVMLCYEAGGFCHRHLVGRILGIEVEELT